MKAVLSFTAVVCALCGGGLRAQSVDTGILGTVADSSGAIIPGATVTITQLPTAIAGTVVTGATGAYEVRYLVPGDYVVEVRQTGFRSEKSSAITLVIGQMARLAFKLQVGEVSEQVQVTAEGVMLETQSGVLGGLVTAQSIVNLPLNGRNFMQLGNLTPGVISSGAATSGSFRANGARSQYQQISFGGVTAVNNRAYNEFMFPSVDAVQEFKVQSSNYSAEYRMGDILNTDAQGEIRPNVVPGVSPVLPNDQRTLDRWFNIAAFTRATTNYGTAPRNPLVGPGLSTADLSFSKSFRTREHDRIEFRFEAFNALNTPQFGNPRATLRSTNFGRVTRPG